MTSPLTVFSIHIPNRAFKKNTSNITYQFSVSSLCSGWLSVYDTDTTIAIFGTVRISYLPNCKHEDAQLMKKLINTLSVRWVRSKLNSWYHSATPEKIGRNIFPQNHSFTKTMVSRKTLRQGANIWGPGGVSSGSLKQVFKHIVVRCNINLPPPWALTVFTVRDINRSGAT